MIEETKLKATPPSPRLAGSVYWPLFKHMADNHNLTLLDSEMEDIMRVCDHISRTGNMVGKPARKRCPSVRRYFLNVILRRIDHLGARVASNPQHKPNWDRSEFEALKWAIEQIATPNESSSPTRRENP